MCGGEKGSLSLWTIKESVGKTDLLKAMVLLPDSTGERFDTIRPSGQRQTREQKWDKDKKKQLTMDVKLKREYNHGWLINAQGGYGTKNRYTGRLFASWFSPTTNIALIGYVNNLNDNREPGKNDTWTPELMPSGTKEYRMGSFNYNYESPESDRYADGGFAFKLTEVSVRLDRAVYPFLGNRS